jgi:alcohol dehydrogenase
MVAWCGYWQKNQEVRMLQFNGFEFAATPTLYVGWGVVERQLATQLRQFKARRIMLVTGRHVAERACRYLAPLNGVHHVIVQGEPTVALIDKLVTNAPQDIDLVVGIGGGSVLDAAKAIAGLLPERYSVLDYLEGVGCGRTLQQPPVAFIAVPTTAGTGSETTKNAVISEPGRFKKSFRDARLVAYQAWLDPSWLEDCPASVLYPTAMDALTQLIESYVTLKANPMTDALAWQGMVLFQGALAALDGDDEAQKQQAFANLMLAASLSGITLANAGLGAVHGLAGPIGAFFDAPHGVVCARLLAPITRENIQALRAQSGQEAVLRKYGAIARLLRAEPTEAAYADDAESLIDELERLTQRYVTQGLAAYGLTAQNVALVIGHCRAGSMLGNPLVLPDEALLRALIAAL